MNFVLRLKHWQVFMLLLIGSLATNFTWRDEELISLIINFVGVILYFFWYFAVGLELTDRLPPRVELPRTLFIINAFVIIISIVVVVVVFNGRYVSNGLAGLVWVVYLMFALFQFMFYPCKALKSIEDGTDAAFGKYFMYVLLIIFWPFGVWLIQPKLNKIETEDK